MADSCYAMRRWLRNRGEVLRHEPADNRRVKHLANRLLVPAGKEQEVVRLKGEALGRPGVRRLDGDYLSHFIVGFAGLGRGALVIILSNDALRPSRAENN